MEENLLRDLDDVAASYSLPHSFAALPCAVHKLQLYCLNAKVPLGKAFPLLKDVAKEFV